MVYDVENLGVPMIIYGKYGGAALRAVHLMVQNNYDHITAWDMAIFEAFGEDLGEKKQYKNNPKVTFLTLCSLGSISCIMPIHYDTAIKTKKYVTTAIDILSSKDKSTPINPDDLWQEVIAACDAAASLKHNNQMDVVLTLWYANVLNTNWSIDELELCTESI